MKNKMLKLKQSAISDYLPLIIAFAIIVAFFGIMAPNFFAVRNFLNILLYAANVAILACTMTLILVAGHIDLSIGSVIALAGVVLGKCMEGGMSVWASIGITMFVCLLTGLYNGIMITKVKVNAFITTLAGMQIFRGIAYLMTSGKSIPIADPVIKAILDSLEQNRFSAFFMLC